MIGYITLGTNDLERAAAFYDELLSVYGAKRAMHLEKMILWRSASQHLSRAGQLTASATPRRCVESA